MSDNKASHICNAQLLQRAHRPQLVMSPRRHGPGLRAHRVGWQVSFQPDWPFGRAVHSQLLKRPRQRTQAHQALAYRMDCQLLEIDRTLQGVALSSTDAAVREPRLH